MILAPSTLTRPASSGHPPTPIVFCSSTNLCRLAFGAAATWPTCCTPTSWSVSPMTQSQQSSRQITSRYGRYSAVRYGPASIRKLSNLFQYKGSHFILFFNARKSATRSRIVQPRGVPRGNETET